jgi:hypothetical protein
MTTSTCQYHLCLPDQRLLSPDHTGPTNIDRNNVSLNFLLDRSPADVRGSKPASLMATEPTGLNASVRLPQSSHIYTYIYIPTN